MKSFVKLIAAGLVLSSAAEAEDVNVYSYRQPELIKPITDAFRAFHVFMRLHTFHHNINIKQTNDQILHRNF
ncbi:MAG: hypothetical protein CMM39_01850 [Rhodospirillaceae bacterium]|nr:hypothetical protein [Rhodospirillaceae bacterium]